MDLSDITPVILTWNEAPNLARCLEPLRHFPRVIVLDSLSTDDTEAIARSHPNVEFHQRCFDDHTSQWNHGVAKSSTLWVLSLDADYLIDSAFISVIQNLSPADGEVSFLAKFKYCVWGRPLRGTLYPPRAVLFRKDACSYQQDGHTQLLVSNGQSSELPGTILHDDRKPLARWIQSQDRYAKLEAEKLCRSSFAASLPAQDRLRKCIGLAPFAVLIYCLVYKGLLLDGWRGWYYTLQRVLAEVILALYLLDYHFSDPVGQCQKDVLDQPPFN